MLLTVVVVATYDCCYLPRCSSRDCLPMLFTLFTLNVVVLLCRIIIMDAIYFFSGDAFANCYCLKLWLFFLYSSVLHDVVSCISRCLMLQLLLLITIVVVMVVVCIVVLNCSFRSCCILLQFLQQLITVVVVVYLKTAQRVTESV